MRDPAPRDLDALAMVLDGAARDARAVPQLGADPAHAVLSLDEAYDIQRLSLLRRHSRGERRIGVKMGFTSRAKMVQMGVNDMIWGRLTDQMLVEPGSAISFRRFVHPRAEPEIAFLLNSPLSGRIDAMTAMAAVAGIAPAIEIIDSRYENFKFSLTDVVADNSSSSAVVIGPWGDHRADFGNLGMVLEIDGAARQIGSSAAILGHPLFSLVAAARLVAERGERLEAGDIVMAGAATAAEALAPGQFVRLGVERLGSVAFSVGD
jgi:2-oxo-3-hexenedioate decarboxylase